ncbi:MAG: hypothetical protein Q8T13_15555 [Acidobacteriota bacterium]|nr:hypothetical protein [Acidobacteriota bacterium]
MTTRNRILRWWVGPAVLSLAMSGLAVSQTASGVYEVHTERQQLQSRAEAEHRALHGTPNDTRSAHVEIDRRMHGDAIGLESKRQDAFKQLVERAGINMPESTGTLPTAEGSRGLQGDIDTRSLSGQDFHKFRKAATEMGYHVDGQGDSITIRELDVTTHRRAPREFGPVGSSASETAAIGRASNRETGLAFESGDHYVSVLDNTRKGGAILKKDPLSYSYEERAKLGKMVGRNIAAVGGADPGLLDSLERLKRGASWESAGVVPEHATPEQRAKAIRDFHQRAERANAEAYTKAKQLGQARDADLVEQVRRAPDARSRAAAQRELLQYRGEVLGAQTNIQREHGGPLLTELEGSAPSRRVLDDGTIINVDPGTGKPLTRSQMLERTTRGAKTSAVAGARLPAATTRSKGVRNAGTFLLVAGAVFGGLEGAERAKAERAPGDGFLKTAGKGIVYGVWYTSGIPGTAGLIDQTSQEGLDEYYQWVAKGGDPQIALARASFKSGGMLALRLAFESTGLLVGTTVELGIDAYGERTARLAQELAQQDQADAALGIARRYAAELDSLAAAIAVRANWLRSNADVADALRGDAEAGRARIRTAKAELLKACAAADALPAAPAEHGAGAEATLAPRAAQAGTLADGACDAAARIVADVRAKGLAAEALAVRIDSTVQRPLTAAAALLAQTRAQLRAQTAASAGTEALMARAARARLAMQTELAEAAVLETSARATAEVFDRELASLDAAASRFDQVRSAFLAGVRRFYNIDSTSEQRDADFRTLITRVSAITIDRAALLRLRESARSIHAIGLLRIDEMEARAFPDCPRLETLWQQAELAALRRQALAELLDDADRRVQLGMACRDRLQALAGRAPVPTAPVPESPRQPTPTPPSQTSAARACGNYTLATLRKLWAEHAEVKKTGKKTVSLDYMFAGDCLAACPALSSPTLPTDAALQACITQK